MTAKTHPTSVLPIYYATLSTPFAFHRKDADVVDQMPVRRSAFFYSRAKAVFGVKAEQQANFNSDKIRVTRGVKRQKRHGSL